MEQRWINVGQNFNVGIQLLLQSLSNNMPFCWKETLIQYWSNVKYKFLFALETCWKKCLEQRWMNVGQNSNVGIQLLLQRPSNNTPFCWKQTLIQHNSPTLNKHFFLDWKFVGKNVWNNVGSTLVKTLMLESSC